MNPYRSTYHAILIGIDDYPDIPLNGCVRDVESIKSLLEHRPEPVNIETFTAPRRLSHDELPQDANRRPTFLNVTEAFARVTKHSQPGDRVYVHFSGHGTRCNTPRDFTNTSTGDLALVLHKEPNQNDIRYLYGWRLASCLKAMVDRGLVVTLVLDCCFAATVYRLSKPLVRFLPPVPETEVVDERDIIDSEYRGLSMGDSWLVDQTGYAIIAACAPHEEAREIESDTQCFGALSLYLYLTLKDTGFNERTEDIFNYIYAKFRKHDFFQRPVSYGNKKQPFFGYNELSTTQSRIPAVFRDDKLILEAGLAHGVRCNDDFLLWPLDKQFANGDSPIPARAITTESLTSLLELETTLPASRHVDWLVEPRTRQVLRNFPIFLSPALTDIEAWQTTLAEHSLSYDQQSVSTFQITQQEGAYIIVDKNSKKLSNLPSLEQSQYRPEDVSAILNHLARYEFARTLSNDRITKEFWSSFKVTVTKSTGEAFGAGHTIDIQDDGNFSSVITLTVENKSRDHLFVYSFVLDPFWQIENSLKTDYEELPPFDKTEGFSGGFSKKLRTEVPEAILNAGLQECTDVLMVLVTKQATSFGILELPPIGEVLRRRAPDRGSSFPTGGLQDWAVFHFPIRTSLKPSSELML